MHCRSVAARVVPQRLHHLHQVATAAAQRGHSQGAALQRCSQEWLCGTGNVAAFILTDRKVMFDTWNPLEVSAALYIVTPSVIIIMCRTEGKPVEFKTVGRWTVMIFSNKSPDFWQTSSMKCLKIGTGWDYTVGLLTVMLAHPVNSAFCVWLVE